MSRLVKSQRGAFISLLLCVMFSISVLAGASGNVLVFINKNKFSDPVVIKVVEGLKKEGYFVKLESGRKLKTANARKYGAIVLFNFIEKGSKDRSVKVFVDENTQKKIVLLNAVGNDYLTPAEGSSETRESRVDNLSIGIVDRVKTVLAAK